MMCPEGFLPHPATQSAQAPPGHPSVPRPEADSLQPLLPSHPGEHVCPLGIPILLHGDQARLRDSLRGTPSWAPPASLGGTLSATWLRTHSVPTNASKSPLGHKQRHSLPILPRSASYTLFRRFSASVYTQPFLTLCDSCRGLRRVVCLRGSWQSPVDRHVGCF